MSNEPEGLIIGQDSERSEIDQELVRRLDELTDRFKRLSGQDDLEQPTPLPEEWARTNRVLERITALENGSRLVGTGGLIASLVDRLERLEAGSVVVGTEAARLIPTDQIRRAEREFSSGSHGSDVFRMSSGSGMTVRQNVLMEAESRIRQYMHPSFSTATIAGVVDALWGRQETDEDYRGRFVAKIKDQPQA